MGFDTPATEGVKKNHRTEDPAAETFFEEMCPLRVPRKPKKMRPLLEASGKQLEASGSAAEGLSGDGVRGDEEEHDGDAEKFGDEGQLEGRP